MSLGWNRRHLVAHAGVHGQILSRLEIVVNVSAEDRLPEPKLPKGRAKPLKILRAVSQEIGKRAEPETPVGAGNLKCVVLHALHNRSELQGVNSSGDKGVIARLERIPEKRLAGGEGAWGL